jgi:8-oxo-dGTP pyrophosphatase MutT (NUDIX family)
LLLSFPEAGASRARVLSVSAASQVLSIQFAALPWRRQNGVLEVLLITTRNTRRWIVPKGWPQESLSPSECAAREALEEAGVVGEIEARPLGTFQYDKRRKNGDVLPLKVELYPMEVIQQRRSWPEKGVRETRWCAIEEALGRVSEPGLRRLIAKFANGSRAAI